MIKNWIAIFTLLIAIPAIARVQINSTVSSATEINGFKCSYSDANTISISAGSGLIDGSAVAPTTATLATWGCGDCSAQAASTEYYVYGTAGSTATTLTELISTSAPGADGKSSTSQVLCSFSNDGQSDIATGSIRQWVGNKFEGPKSYFMVRGWSANGSTNGNIAITDGIDAEVTWGGDVVRTSTAAAGDAYTIQTSGLYLVSLSAQSSGASTHQAISKNSHQLGTAPASINEKDIVVITYAAASTIGASSRIVYLESGDVLRFHVGSAIVDFGTYVVISRIE